MKLKKYIFILISIFLIISIILLSILIYKSHNKTQTLLLGNYLENSEETNINDLFASDFMTSSFLLLMLENDASKTQNEKIIKLSSEIKKSKIVIVNIGINDIKECIKEDSILRYDEEVVKRKLQITISNIKDICTHINKISKNCEINVKLLVYPYKMIDYKLKELINDANEKIKLTFNENGEITNISSFLYSINYKFIENP